jgi:hypothetical protein
VISLLHPGWLLEADEGCFPTRGSRRRVEHPRFGKVDRQEKEKFLEHAVSFDLHIQLHAAGELLHLAKGEVFEHVRLGQRVPRPEPEDPDKKQAIQALKAAPHIAKGPFRL